MIKGTTKSGFAFEVKKDVMNDWEIMEMVADLDEKPMLLVKLAKKILGGEQYRKMKEFHGPAPKTEDISADITDIFTIVGEMSKN